jgi:hypothetical protein
VILSKDVNGQPVSITAGDVVIGYSQAQPIYPNSITIGGEQVLGGSVHCGGESLIGTAAYPAFTLTGDPATWPPDGAPANIPSLTPTLKAEGPAYVQVQLNWLTGKYTCGGQHDASGSSLLTVFPDGRTIRTETISPTDSALPTTPGTACGCSTTASDYYVTSYLTVANAAFSTGSYRAASGPVKMNLPLVEESTGQDLDNPPWACFEQHDAGGPRKALSVVWPKATAGSQTNGSRIKTNTDDTVLLFDSLYASASLGPGNRLMSSAWFLDAGAAATCESAAMDARSAAYATPRRLAVGPTAALGTPISMDATDGIYRLGAAQQAQWFIAVDAATPGTLHAGWAVAMTLAGTSTPRVMLGDASLVDGTDYLIQQAAGMPNRFTFWFPFELRADQVLTVAE